MIGATSFGGDLTLPMKALAPGMMVMGASSSWARSRGTSQPGRDLAFAVRGNFPWRRVPATSWPRSSGRLRVFLNLMYGGILNGATEPTPSISPTVAILTKRC